MADLPESVAQAMVTEQVGNINLSNALARNSTQEINSLLGRASAKRFDELGPVEGRSLSGLLATPIASPAVQQG